MSANQPSSEANRLLASLPEEDRANLLRHGERISLHREFCLATANEPIRHVFFLEGGIASITSKSHENGRTEVGIFGREGVSGTALLLSTDRSPHDTFIQVNGSHALRIEAETFLRAVENSPTLRHTMLRFVQTLLVQTSSSTVSNAHHQIEARLARWLLMCHDRVDGDEVLLTHEFMGMMIGAQRTGVTVALHVLEGIGTIRSTRGRVTILNRCRLQEIAGETYGTPEAEYRRLIGQFGKG